MEKPKIVPPLADAMIAKIFENMETAEAAQSIINAVMVDDGRMPIEKITALRCQETLPGAMLHTRGCRLDVIAEAQGHLVNIEVQRQTYENMIERSFFYGCAKIHGMLKQSEDYDKLPNLTLINLLDYEPPPRASDPDFHQPIQLMYTKRPEIASNILTMHNLELQKFQTLDFDKNNALHRWLYFFIKGYSGMSSPELKEVLKMDMGLQQFADKYSANMRNPTLIDEFEYQQLAERDYITGMSEAEDRGLAKGRSEGSEGAVRAAFRAGVADAQVWIIAQQIGIDKNRFAQIKKEIAPRGNRQAQKPPLQDQIATGQAKVAAEKAEKDKILQETATQKKKKTEIEH